MCYNGQYLVLVQFLIFILPVNSEWVEVSVQKKPRYSTTENAQVLSIPESYRNMSIAKVPTTTSYLDFFISSTTANPKIERTRISHHTNKQTRKNNVIKREDINRRNGEEIMNPSNAFFSILQDVQEDLLKRPRKSFKNKLDVLISLKNKLFLQIQNRISEMWPSTNKSSPRGYKDESYLDFPSNEAALLTIGFLTFAVFLIKLVLKIIHALKSKNQYYPYMPATMITSSKKKRSIQEGLEDQEFLKIMESVQSFPDNYYTFHNNK